MICDLNQFFFLSSIYNLFGIKKRFWWWYSTILFPFILYRFEVNPVRHGKSILHRTKNQIRRMNANIFNWNAHSKMKTKKKNMELRPFHGFCNHVPNRMIHNWIRKYLESNYLVGHTSLQCCSLAHAVFNCVVFTVLLFWFSFIFIAQHNFMMDRLPNCIQFYFYLIVTIYYTY